MVNENQTKEICPICGSKLSTISELHNKTYSQCNWCGYRSDRTKPDVPQKETKKQGMPAGLFGVIGSKNGILFLGFCFLILVLVSFFSGFGFWLTFGLAWFAILLAIMALLVVLAYLARYIVAGAVIVVVAILIYFFATGQGLAGIGVLGIILILLTYLFLLGLFLLLGLLVPAIIVAANTYVALGMSGIAFIAAVIVFVIVAVLTWVILFHIILPFMIGYAICSAAGQIAYLVVTVGFSFEALQRMILEGQLLANLFNPALYSSLAGTYSVAQILIMIGSILFGLLFIVGSIFGSED